MLQKFKAKNLWDKFIIGCFSHSRRSHSEAYGVLEGLKVGKGVQGRHSNGALECHKVSTFNVVQPILKFTHSNWSCCQVWAWQKPIFIVQFIYSFFQANPCSTSVSRPVSFGMMINMKKATIHFNERPPAYETVIEAVEIDMELPTYSVAVNCVPAQKINLEIQQE